MQQQLLHVLWLTIFPLYFAVASCAILGYIVLPVSQIGAEIGRQHWYPALLWTHPSCQLSNVTATAALVLPALSDGVWQQEC